MEDNNIPNVPGYVLLVGKGDNIFYEEVFGMADLENKLPIQIDTRFLIASVSKQFTCMALMILKERGFINYDEPMEKYYPQFPAYKSSVTLRNLMTHTSGIKEYFTDDLKKETALAPLSEEDILKMITSFGDLEFAPGSKHVYSNSNYVLLGPIIEQAAGMSYASFMKENIFKPLNMQDTFACSSPAEKPANLALGYKKLADHVYEKTAFNMITIGWADGNIISTVRDLFKWCKALKANKLVKKQTLEEAYTPYILPDKTSTNYGFGWDIHLWEERKLIGHGGSTIGYMSVLEQFVEEEGVVIILSNLDDYEREDVFKKAAEMIINN